MSQTAAIKTRAMLALQRAMERERERWPCHRCGSYDMCAKESLACEAFARYVSPSPNGRGKPLSRVATRAIYKRIFSDEDEA